MGGFRYILCFFVVQIYRGNTETFNRDERKGYGQSISGDVDDEFPVPAPFVSEQTDSERNVKPKVISIDDNWKKDPSLEDAIQNIDIMDALDFNVKMLDYPLILRGFTDSWTAPKEWGNRALVAQRYGNRTLSMGSQYAIVKDGYATKSISLASFLDQMQYKERDLGIYMYHIGVLKDIPELSKQFDIPIIFRGDDLKHHQDLLQKSATLSIGQSGTGLPFHEHGITWMGLFTGKKVWFVYPPGLSSHTTDVKKGVGKSGAYLVKTWFDQVFPELQKFAYPPANSTEYTSKNYRPMQCVQEPGDVIYIPEMWSHMTMNVGDTVGFGSEYLLRPQIRTQSARSILAKDPDDVNALKYLALGLIYEAQISLIAKEDEELDEYGDDDEPGLPETAMQKFNDAKYNLRKAITLSKDNFELRIHLLELLVNLNDQSWLKTAQEALKIVDDVVAGNDVPSKSIIISMYSKILSAFKRKGDLGNARFILNRMLAIDDKNVNLWVDLALLYLHAEDLENMGKVLRHLNEIDPVNEHLGKLEAERDQRLKKQRSVRSKQTKKQEDEK